ncbi:hypothetical protein GQR58_030638 [Nymphon striatum]|nr:hypothetical protein GQR58_030638 [Nymphon striatum]
MLANLPRRLHGYLDLGVSMSKTRLSHFGSPGRAAAVFAALVLMLTLSACGSDDSAVVADTAPTSATQVEATTNDDGESAGATESTDSTGEDTVEASTAQDASDDDHTHDEDADHDHEAGSNSVESAARYLGSYTLVNDEFGTMVSVTVDEETRIDRLQLVA